MLPTEQAAPGLTDFSRCCDPYTQACKARPLTTVGRTSLSGIIWHQLSATSTLPDWSFEQIHTQEEGMDVPSRSWLTGMGLRRENLRRVHGFPLHNVAQDYGHDELNQMQEEPATLFSEIFYARLTHFEFIRICHSASLCSLFKTMTTVFCTVCYCSILPTVRGIPVLTDSFFTCPWDQVFD